MTPEMRERLSAIAKARWADPVAGEKWRAALGDPARREKVREGTKARWADPSMREKMIMGMRVARGRRNNRDDPAER
jgi:hypothetical protein